MTAFFAQARAWLAAAAIAAGAGLLAFVYALGRRQEAAQQMRQRMRGVEVRSHADIEAARADDPVGELRRGGWVRGVAADHDRPRGPDQR